MGQVSTDSGSLVDMIMPPSNGHFEHTDRNLLRLHTFLTFHFLCFLAKKPSHCVIFFFNSLSLSVIVFKMFSHF